MLKSGWIIPVNSLLKIERNHPNTFSSCCWVKLKLILLTHVRCQCPESLPFNMRMPMFCTACTFNTFLMSFLETLFVSVTLYPILI